MIITVGLLTQKSVTVNPDQCGSVGWASSHKAKGCQFDSWSGHIWAASSVLIRGMTSNWWIFLPLFLPPIPSLLTLNKIFKRKWCCNCKCIVTPRPPRVIVFANLTKNIGIILIHSYRAATVVLAIVFFFFFWQSNGRGQCPWLCTRVFHVLKILAAHQLKNCYSRIVRFGHLTLAHLIELEGLPEPWRSCAGIPRNCMWICGCFIFRHGQEQTLIHCLVLKKTLGSFLLKADCCDFEGDPSPDYSSITRGHKLF